MAEGEEAGGGHGTAVTLTLCLLTAFTVAGNLLVLAAFAARPAIRGVRSNMYIVSLAVTDLLVGAVAMPANLDFHLHLQSWRHHDALCLFWLFTDTAVCTASVWNMVAIAADRLAAVATPVRYMRLGRVSAAVALTCVWAWSLAVCLPPLVIQKVYYEQCRIINDLWYDVYTPLGAFFLPLAIICACYSVVFFRLWRKMREKEGRERRRGEMERKMTLAAKNAATVAAAATNVNGTITAMAGSRASLTPSSHYGTATTHLEATPTSSKNVTPLPSPKISMEKTTSASSNSPKLSFENTRTTAFSSSSSPKKTSSASKKDSLQSAFNLSQEKKPSLASSPKILVVEATFDEGPSCSLLPEEKEEEEEQSPDKKKKDSLQVVGNPLFGNCGRVASTASEPARTDQNHPPPPSPGGESSTMVSLENDETVATRLLMPPPRKRSSKLYAGLQASIGQAAAIAAATAMEQEEGESGEDRAELAVDLLQASAPAAALAQLQQERHSSIGAWVAKYTKRPENGGKQGRRRHRRGGRVTAQSIVHREKKVLVQMLVLVVAFIFCWLPFWTFYVTLAFCFRMQTCEYHPWYETAGAAFQWLGYANSSLNPVLYTIFNSEFRAAFGHIARSVKGAAVAVLGRGSRRR